MFTNHMHKLDLALNNLWLLIYHKIQPNLISHLSVHWSLVLVRVCHIYGTQLPVLGWYLLSLQLCRCFPMRFTLPLLCILGDICRSSCAIGRVFANGLGDWGSIPGQIIPKTQKMVLDTSLLNTKHYKVCIKGKVEQSREKSSTLPYTLV